MTNATSRDCGSCKTQMRSIHLYGSRVHQHTSADAKGNFWEYKPNTQRACNSTFGTMKISGVKGGKLEITSALVRDCFAATKQTGGMHDQGTDYHVGYLSQPLQPADIAVSIKTGGHHGAYFQSGTPPSEPGPTRCVKLPRHGGWYSYCAGFEFTSSNSTPPMPGENRLQRNLVADKPADYYPFCYGSTTSYAPSDPMGTSECRSQTFHGNDCNNDAECIAMGRDPLFRAQKHTFWKPCKYNSHGNPLAKGEDPAQQTDAEFDLLKSSVGCPSQKVAQCIERWEGIAPHDSAAFPRYICKYFPPAI